MKTAVILAAGMGTRLGGELTDRPKGFLELGDRPIIEESVQRLSDAGIERIVIVTGYGSEHYEKLAARYPQLIETVHNAEFENSGSLYSLFCARRKLEDESFLLLESDLIYEPRALDILIGFEQPDAILLSGPTGAGDEVYVESRDGMLVSMSKYREALGQGIAGELVGISKISRGLFGLMLNIAEDHFEKSLWFDYETDGLVAAAHNWAIACPVINGLVWTEIDDAAQLERARTEVYPKLQQAD